MSEAVVGLGVAMREDAVLLGRMVDEEVMMFVGMEEEEEEEGEVARAAEAEGGPDEIGVGITAGGEGLNSIPFAWASNPLSPPPFNCGTAPTFCGTAGTVGALTGRELVLGMVMFAADTALSTRLTACSWSLMFWLLG